MGIEIPGALRWVSEHVVGQDWPDADETAMERVASGWRENGNEFSDILEDAKTQINSARNGIDGSLDPAIQQYWDRIDAALAAATELSFQLSQDMDGAAEEVRNAKLKIIQALVALAAQLAAIAAWAVVTAGLASPAALGAQAATRFVVQMIMRWLQTELVKRIAVGAAKGAGKGALEAALQEGALQWLEERDGRRASFDFGDIAEAGLQGGFKGGLEGAVDGAIEGLGPAADNRLVQTVKDETVGKAADAAQEHLVGKPRAADELKEELDRLTGVDGAGEVLDKAMELGPRLGRATDHAEERGVAR
ncbi:hypothetical protein [Rhodococcus sp. HNM0569]|uniref:WXG100-like domain-containing protein n=1 Tax=Rhodococcus sp. HNM0569 TaxID=2716340 RepID=UPI00146DC582|nr:hypothetical protein [Rhodococcus sp. HNM0569]NLU83602.1 hypothetical protein [Rhodococcus sp. HNM0569]